MAKLSPREMEQRRRFRLAVGLIALIAAVLGPILWIWIRALVSNVPLDPDTLCATDRPPSAEFVLLVDSTDSYSALQRAAALEKFEAIQQRVPKLARLTVFALGAEDGDEISPLVSLCNPGTGEDVSRLDDRPELRRKRWETGFQRPLERLMDRLLDASTASRSPILAKIQAISVTGFEGDEGDRHVFLISDLLQHDAGYSHYAGQPPRFEEFERSGLLDRYFADLDGVKVHITYVRRDGMEPVQGRHHILFWEKYFDSLGAQVVEVDRLAG